ncbi:MAG: SAM-dependent methyltransferase [Prevotellaceae bacterium]|jgi:16S rRNA (cytidine1402-2'-O)-methyltransferase|nr:SAM-dependent methyltransferase [Prevotellaceae bacterium]
MQGKLYLIPAPLSDSDLNFSIPENVKIVAGKLKYFVVEDLRTARRYLSRLKVEIPISEIHFSLLNEHTGVASIDALLAPILQGNDMGLLSDAGLPCIADPGEELVRIAHSKGIKVVPLTGPSSIFMALAASGLSGERFSFEGYLPVKTVELSKRLKKLEQWSRLERQSIIFIETPYRSAKMLETILNVCSRDTLLCVACNITADDEFVKTATVAEWKKNIPSLNKKPCIFIIQALLV